MNKFLLKHMLLTAFFVVSSHDGLIYDMLFEIKVHMHTQIAVRHQVKLAPFSNEIPEKSGRQSISKALHEICRIQRTG